MSWVRRSVLLIIGTLLLIPMYWTISGSFKYSEGAFKIPADIIPVNPTLENWVELFAFPVWKWTTNSLVVVVAVTSLSILILAAAGYGFALKKAPSWIFWTYVFAMMLPSQVALVPTFILIKKLHLMNTRMGLVLPFVLNIFGIFLYRFYLKGFPRDYIDAGQMDGMGELAIFFRLVMPLTRPPLAALATFTWMGTWNSFLWPLVIATRDSQRTLVPGIAEIVFLVSQQWIDGLWNYGVQMAGATFVFVPLFVGFCIFQKHFIKGLYFGGIK